MPAQNAPTRYGSVARSLHWLTALLILSAIGGTVATIGTGVVSALINTVMSVILLVVLAAIQPDRVNSHNNIEPS
mgnify:CR=1 FL=1